MEKILCPRDRTVMRPVVYHRPLTLPHVWCPSCVGVYAVNTNTPNLVRAELELIPCEHPEHYIELPGSKEIPQ